MRREIAKYAKKSKEKVELEEEEEVEDSRFMQTEMPRFTLVNMALFS